MLVSRPTAVGNTFSFVVFMIYGGVFFGWAVELTPRYAVGDAYDLQNHNVSKFMSGRI